MSILGEKRKENDNCLLFLASKPKRSEQSVAAKAGNPVFCNDHSGRCKRGAPFGWSASLSQSLQNTIYDGEKL